MRRVFAFLAITVDGYHEGTGRELDWHNSPDAADSGYPTASGFLDLDDPDGDEADSLVFGRVTYELMASYWPTPEAKVADPQIADRMNSLRKYVASRTLNSTEWRNASLLEGDAATAIRELKQGPGKSIAILGSSTLTANLLGDGVVDELRILVNPSILGAGRPVFASAPRCDLTLTNTRTFPAGNVLLYYEPTSARS